MKEVRIYALRNTLGANIDAFGIHKLTIMVASLKEGSQENVMFKRLASFEFDASEDENPIGNIQLEVPTLEISEEFIKRSVEYRALECVKNLVLEMSLVFGDMPMERAPSISEFIEVCIKDKVAILAKEEKPDIQSGKLPEIEAVSVIGSLIDGSVKSYHASSN